MKFALAVRIGCEMWREIRVDGLLRHKAQSIVLDGVMRVNGFGKTRDDPED
jgi:hypothetical protein